MEEIKPTEETGQEVKPAGESGPNRKSGWLKKAGAALAVLAGVLAALAALAQIIDFLENRRATPTPPPLVTPISTLVPTSAPTFTPTSGPFQFLIFPQQVRVGEEVKITLQAWQGAACFLAYYTPSGTLSSADGLGLVTADSQGRCTWEWHISANTLPGRGRVVISINDVEETHFIEILPGN